MKWLLVMLVAVGIFAVTNGWISVDSFTNLFTDAWVSVFKSELFTVITGSSILGFILSRIASQS